VLENMNAERGKDIYFIAGEFPPMRGGMGDYTRELGIALAQQGWHVHVITHVQAGEASKDTRVATYLTVHPIIKRWNWTGIRALVRFLRHKQPAFVHIQYQTAAYHMHPAINTLPWLLQRVLPQTKVLITYHDLLVPYLFPKAGSLRQWITFFPARHADLVIVTNTEDEITAHKAGLRPVRIPIGANVHPQSVTSEDVRRTRERWHIPPQRTVIGYFGFLNHSKGVTDLLSAVGRLVEEGENVHLLMMGEPLGASDPTNKAYMEEVTALIEAQHLEDRVHWTGFLDDKQLSVGFALTDMVVLPYRDGVSLRRGTLHAALANGAAIITTYPRVPIPELQEAVWLSPPADPHALTYAIRHLLRTPHLRKS